MSSPIQPVRVVFQADDADVAVALRNVQNGLRRVQSEAGRTTAATSGIAGGTDRMAAGFRRAAQSLSASTVGAQAWTRGLHALEAQQAQTTQTTARLTAAVHPVAAAMSSASTGTALFAARLRALDASGIGLRKGIPGLEGTNQTLKATAPAALSASSALRTLATSYAAIKVGQLAAGSLRDASALHDLAQETGATAETLSILRFAGAQSGLTLDDLSQTFRGLARALRQLNDGSGETVDAFADIGLSARDLNGLSVDQAFIKIAQSIAALPDGFDKAAIATRLFGRSGQELIPLLNELRGDGFDKLAESARKANAVVGGDSAAAADKLGDEWTKLTASLKGLVLTIAGPMLPLLTRLAEGLGFVAQQAASAFETLKQLPGVLQAMPFGLGNLFLPTIPQEDFSGVQAGGGTTAAGSQGPQRATEGEIRALGELREAGRLTEDQQKRIRDIVRELEADYKKAADDVVRQASILKQIEILTKRIKVDTTGAKDARREELALIRQQAQEAVRALSLTQLQLSGSEQANRQAFDAGLTTLRDFFATRREILLDNTSAEITALLQQQEAIRRALALPRTADQSEADRRAEIVGLEAELAELDARIVQAQVRGRQERQAIDSEEAAGAAALVQARLQYELQIQQAKGQTLGVALVAINEEANAFASILAQGDLSAQQQAERVQAFREALTLQAQAADLNRQVEEEFGGLSRDRQAVEDRLLTGKLTERQATEQIAAIERERIPALQALADEMARLADESGDPALREQAAQLAADLNSLAASADLAGQRAAAFRESLADAVQSDLTQFLGSTISQVESLEEAFLELGRSIASTFQQAFASKLIDDLRRSIEGIGSIALPDAPTALTPDLLAEQVAAAPDLSLELGAAQLQTGAATLQVAAATLGTGASALVAPAATLQFGATSLQGAAATWVPVAAQIQAAALTLLAAAKAAGGSGSDVSKDLGDAVIGGIIDGSIPFARGGTVPGFGTGDTVRAMLTPREYVQPVRAVNYYGTDVMEAMRRLKVPREIFKGVGRYSLHVPKSPRFATGGMVAPVAVADGKGGEVTLNLRVDREAIVDVVDATVPVHIKNNRRPYRDMLGGQA